MCALYAGVFAPVALLLVAAAILYLFRKIYAEVGTALPLNGGLLEISGIGVLSRKKVCVGCGKKFSKASPFTGVKRQNRRTKN